jgi:hypothetical protein
MATIAPSAARRFAIAAPMPREPPVTSATLLVKLDINLLLIFGEMIDRFTGSTDRHPARGCQPPLSDVHPCNQIWRPWEYHLFPDGMHSAEEEAFLCLCIYGMIRSSRSLVSCRLKLSCVSIQSAKPALRILIVLRIVSSPKLSIQSTKDQFAICSYGVACSP